MKTGSSPSSGERLFQAAQALWLGAKKSVEAAVGAERVDRWLDALRFYEIKSRLIRHSRKLPDGNVILYRPMDALVVDEVYDGCYSAATLRPGDTVVDVGANIGTFTILAARKIGPQGRLVCVEPEPENARLLAANISRNGLTWVSRVEAALDRAPGRLKLYRSGNPGMHSLLPRYSRSVEVAVQTLDEVTDRFGLGKIDLLKIDVEGAELGAIAGGPKTLARSRQVILETHAVDVQEVRSVLTAQGFEVKSAEETVGGITVYAVARGASA